MFSDALSKKLPGQYLCKQVYVEILNISISSSAEKYQKQTKLFALFALFILDSLAYLASSGR